MSFISHGPHQGELYRVMQDHIMTYAPVAYNFVISGGVIRIVTGLVLCVGLVLAVAYVSTLVNRLPTWTYRMYQRLFNFTERTIVHLQSTDYRFNMRDDSQENAVLQRAIKVYLGQHSDEATYKSASVELIQPSTSTSNYRDMKSPRSAKQLRNLRLAVFPNAEMTRVVGTKPPIYISFSESVGPCSQVYYYRRTSTIRLRTYARNGQQVLRDFVEKCNKEYMALVKKDEDKSHYIYQLQVSKSAEKPTEDEVPLPSTSLYKKYKLSGEKTFDTIFFPQKPSILNLISDFSSKQGKFAIEGFPQKLGLLLYGPPGTGKTTFVKALATHMNRHIVVVPLSMVKTNQELYDIMFEGMYPVVGNEGSPDRLTFSDVIFLMEEIDAATDIVKARGPATQETTMQRDLENKARGMEERANSSNVESASSSSEGMAEREGSSAEGPSNTLSEPSSAAGGDSGTAVNANSALTKLMETPDKLDLAGLLNVLDGVVDSPSRVVVMTTNHPERLDPALIRPGRINLKLLFNYIVRPDVDSMLKHFFGEDEFAAKQGRVDTVWNGKVRSEPNFKVTPAEMEQICVESETIDEVCDALERFPNMHSTFNRQED